MKPKKLLSLLLSAALLISLLGTAAFADAAVTRTNAVTVNADGTIDGYDGHVTLLVDGVEKALTPGTYYLKSYVYYKYNGQYIRDSVEWSTFRLQSSASIELNRDTYTYTVSYIKTSVPKKTFKLKAEVEGTDSAVAWSSSDETVATVNASGKVSMIGLGTCEIIATVDGVSTSCEVTVKKQTGTAYYKKYLKEYYDEILDCFEDPFTDVAEMREDCDDALEEALELKAAISKVKILKTDATVKKYMNVLLTNIRKADDLAWVDGISAADAQMEQYRQQNLKYLRKLNSRIRTLLK
mgnify:CR=1 FL=1